MHNASYSLKLYTAVGRQHTRENVQMLEVAGGTGRFATLVKVCYAASLYC